MATVTATPDQRDAVRGCSRCPFPTLDRQALGSALRTDYVPKFKHAFALVAP